MTDRTGNAPGGEGDDTALTGAGASTARDEFDHEGRPRPDTVPSDEGAAARAARELDESEESEPTRSE